MRQPSVYEQKLFIYKLFGHPVGATVRRLSDDPIPPGYFTYDIRSGADRLPQQVQNFVCNGYWGSIISSRPVDLPVGINGNPCREIQDEDFVLTKDSMRLLEYIARYRPEPDRPL